MDGRDTDMILSIKQRLRSLEKVSAGKRKAALFTVSFRNGEQRKLLPGEVITAVHGGNVCQVDSIPGSETGNGLLLELLRGLLEV